MTDDLSTTYAIFRYDKLEWHTYTSQDGSIVRGPATAGGNAGDKTNGFNLNSLMADPKDIVYLTLQSNVGYGGVFVYRVDLGPSKLEHKITGLYYSYTFKECIYNNI